MITIASASDHSVSLRTSYDPFISCWDRPPTSRNGLPAGYLQSDYQNNLLLCSSAHGVPQANVGCFCSTPGTDVHCSQNIADPRLWSAVVDWYDHGEEHYSFPEYCRISCECLTESEAQAEYRGDIDWYGGSYENLIDMSGVFPSNASNNSSNGKSDASNATTSSSPRDSATTTGQSTTNHQPDQNAPAQNAQAPPVMHDQCGNNCTSNEDCSTGRNKSCMCSTQSQQYQRFR